MPIVHLAPRALERIKRGAIRYLESETGEALVGVKLPDERKKDFPTMYILETISPMQNVIRNYAMFEQGDDWQGDVFNWLNENWELYRDLRRGSYGKAASTQWDLPLEHLGDWHKQPGGMTEPSQGDFETAKAFLKENQMNYLLTPIVTLADEAAHTEPAENTLICDDVSPAVRIDFWGLSRKSRDFILLKPVVALGYGLPRLPDVVWWLDNEQRLGLEIEALERNGLEVMDIAQFNADQMPPLETCFTIYRPGAQQVILVATPHTYPKKQPLWYLAPLMRPSENEDFCESLFRVANPVPAEAVKAWSGAEHALVDGVRMIEAYLEKVS